MDTGTEAYTTKAFVLTVKLLDITDIEAVYFDYEWLFRYSILWQNLSQNAVMQDLSFPATGPNSSGINWVSDTPSVIANDGTVNRPEHGKGHKTVKITAAISKDDAQYTAVFYYVVLEQPDTVAPNVLETSPENNGSVPWDTDVITMTFSETIVAGPTSTDMQTFGVELEETEPNRINVQIKGDMLVITPYTELSTGVNRLIIPDSAFADAADNPSVAYEISFTVEARPARTIVIISTTPQDLALDVHTDKIKICFDSTDIQFGEEFNRRCSGKKTGRLRQQLRGQTRIP